MSKQKIIIAILVLVLSSCCESITEESKIADKMCAYNDRSNYWEYCLLFENGEQRNVESYQYVKAKIGDVWTFNKCK